MKSELKNCFACGYSLKTAQMMRCVRCGWGNGDGNCISDNDPRYLVMLSLAKRAEAAMKEELKNVQDHVSGMSPRQRMAYRPGQWLRLEPSAREFAMLEKGDQIKVDNEIWRITTKGDGFFWMRRFPVPAKFRQPADNDESEDPAVMINKKGNGSSSRE